MCKILIIDNSYSLIKIKEYDSFREYKIDEINDISNYNNVVNKIFSFKPHIVVINLSEKQYLGLNILKQLVKIKLDIKYIAVGKNNDYKSVREAFITGADEYIVSPVDEDIVKESIFRFKNEDISNNIDYKILSIRSDDLSKVTNKIIKITNAEYNNGINLKKISKMIDLNSAYLGRVFLKETGIKYSEYLMLYRLHKAKNMIIMSSENISEIDNKVGYTNSNYFYIHFNKTFGISPSDFRNNVI